MRSIDDIIADACQTAAGSLREAFALGGLERAAALKARFETALLDGSATPGPVGSAKDEMSAQAERPRHEPPRRDPLPRPGPRAILLGVIAILTLALCHARAARLLPAYALLIGLGALLRDWTEDDCRE
jgi:hypothetical protein